MAPNTKFRDHDVALGVGEVAAIFGFHLFRFLAPVLNFPLPMCLKNVVTRTELLFIRKRNKDADKWLCLLPGYGTGLAA